MTNPSPGEQPTDRFPDIAYQSEDAARAELEDARWPSGVFCPKCGSLEKCWRIRSHCERERRGARAGVWRCSLCRRQFTVTVGTALQKTRLPLNRILRGLTCISSSPGAVDRQRASSGVRNEPSLRSRLRGACDPHMGRCGASPKEKGRTRRT
ncbi:MAG: transposase [Bryobacterales bacterium]|nr:transposase [Bryobacterales bacterium]